MIGREPVEWWAHQWWFRVFYRLVWWWIAAGACVLLPVSVYAGLFSTRYAFLITAVSMLFVLYLLWWGRSSILGIAMRGEELLVSHLGSARASESIPLAGIRSMRIRRFLFAKYLIIKGPGRISMMLHHAPLPIWPQVQHWDDMIATLKARLQPLGKWRD